MRGVRRINPFTAGLLLVGGTLFAIIGVLQLTRALPTKEIVARGSVFGSNHEPGGRYSGESWDVYIDVAGHGSQIAYSHALYKAVQRIDPLAVPAVIVHMRGSLVTQVDLSGHTYTTSAVSSTEAWIEAIVLLLLGALTFALLVRTIRRGLRARRASAER